MRALTIARFTVQEAASRRLILAGVVLSLAFLALYALGCGFLYGKAVEDALRRGRDQALETLFAGVILTTLGLYAVHFLSSFVALFLSVASISGEIDAGTLHAILARPVRRYEFVLGRWLGFAVLISAYVALMAGALLLISRLIAGYEVPDPARLIALMVFGSLLLLTLSLAGSALMPTLANGVVVFSLFGLAWLAGIIEFLGGPLQNDAMVNLGVAVSLLVPSDGLWRAASYYAQSPAALALAPARLMNPFSSLAPPASAFLVWSAGYLVAALGVAVATFSRRDL